MNSIHSAHLLSRTNNRAHRLLQKLEKSKTHHRKESSPLSAKSSITPEDHISLTSTTSPAKHVIKKRAALEQQPTGHKPTAGEIAKDVAISAIPIVGTVQEFRKGNIGWGIFSLFTDLLCLIPVIGPLARVVSGAIRGGAVAARAIRAGAVAVEAGTKIATAVAETGAKAAVVATEAGAKAAVVATEAGAKAATAATEAAVKAAAAATEVGAKAVASTSEAAAKVMTITAKEGTKEFAKASAELAKAVLRAMDPGVELLYNAGKGVGEIATGFFKTDISLPFIHSFFRNNSRLKNFAPLLEKRVQWNFFDNLNNTVEICEDAAKSHKKYVDLSKAGSKLSVQFLQDFPRAQYIINGKKFKIDTKNIEKRLKSFEKVVPDPKQRQLISAFADQGIFGAPTGKIFADVGKNLPKNTNLAFNQKEITYTINTLENGTINLTSKYIADLESVSDSGFKETLGECGLRADMILSRDKVPEPVYSYYLV